MGNNFSFNQKDKNGEYVEFSFPKESVEIENPEEYHLKFKYHLLSTEEKKNYYNYLLANIEHGIVEKADEVYKYLIGGFTKNIDSEDIAFIGLYSIYLECKKAKYNEEGNKRKEYEGLKLPSLKIYKFFTMFDANGLYEEGSKKVAVAKVPSTFKSIKEVLEFIFVVCHETRHFIQEYEAENNILNSSSLSTCVDDEFGRWNYWFRTIEIDANEHAYKSVIEIFEKYIATKFTQAVDSETGKIAQLDDVILKYIDSLIDNHKSKLDILLKSKSISFAFSDEGISHTDISDIDFILKKGKKFVESNDDIGLKDYLDKLIKIGAIPKIFIINSKNEIVLQTEEKLLEGYFSSGKGEKEVYEKALKYIYTYVDTNKSEDSFYYISELKIRFIEEQINKEKEHMKKIEEIQKDKSYSSNFLFGDSIWDIIDEIINIRLKRIKYYSMITEATNTMLHKEAESLYEELKILYQSLLSNIEDTDRYNTSYIHEDSNTDFTNTMKR